jgi:peptidyl-prolyl cis-trans isomerase B (cyclophilin B)
VLVGVIVGISSCDTGEIKDVESDPNITYYVEADPNLTYYADIDIKDYGMITVKLDQSAAPKTVGNFISLAQSGFYDGLTFHRIIEGFMMQGGDPEGNGTGGAEKTVVGEFSANGHNNPISHKRGVISMARANDYNSASSQFFIVHEDSEDSLDGKYAAFGHVISGMEVVDKICETVPQGYNGAVAEADKPVIKSITIRTEPKS